MTTRNTYLDLLKFMAIVIMILDHVGNYLLPDDLFTTHVIRGIGRFAMPLFFIVHGYLLATLPHLPSKARNVKLVIYGAFLSIALYDLTGEFTLNILYQFAMIEALWIINVDGIISKKESIYCMFEVALFFLMIELSISFEQFSLEQIIDYGIYPLFYGIAGLMFGYSRQYTDQKLEKLAFVVLVTALSIQYNPFLSLLYALYVDGSIIYYALPAIVIPALVWYMPKAKIELTVLRSPIALVSRNALNIYVSHLLIIVAIRHVPPFAT